MTEYSQHSVDDLIHVITTWPVGMPVRAMERVLSMGDDAVPSLVAALDRWRADEERDLLWLVVLLGELRSADAVQTLIDRIQATDDEELAEGAAEGLAKIGTPALPALSQLITARDPVVRIYVYGALSGIHDDLAYSLLSDALGRDRELADVVAEALSEQGRSEAVPLLYDAYLRCDPWQRAEFEEAIGGIHCARSEPPLGTANWRARYRRDPVLGSFGLSWVSIAVILQKHKPEVSKRPSPPVRSLEEILERAASNRAPKICENCGAPEEQPTGIPVCPEIALGMAVQQIKFLGEARSEGVDDIFELLDALEAAFWEHLEKKEHLAARKREQWQVKTEALRINRQTLRWLIEQGTESIGQARALLLAKAAELAHRFGDPDRLFLPPVQTQRRFSKTGRNDPCPCGSGQKYKRCCLGKAEETPT
jgi:hypothetical protein